MKNLIFLFLLFFTVLNPMQAQEVILKIGKNILRETGKAYTGICKEYGKDNKLKSATSIKNGMLDDSTAICYPSGSIKEVRS